MAFSGVVAFWGLTRAMDRSAWRALAAAQALPAALLGALYLQHLGGALRSDLMADALDSGGWLTGWLVTSPAQAWAGLLKFQVFHLPQDFQSRSALLLLAALAASVLSREGTVTMLAGTALAAALSASVVGLYPFGQSRHNTWLVAFTLPAFGWLIGHVIERGRRSALAAAGVLALALLAGRPMEGWLGARRLETVASLEQLIRQDALAPLVVAHLDPASGPRIILVSEQSYNLLMPLYARERPDATRSPESGLLAFRYGARDVVVVRSWDWDSLEHARRVVGSLPTHLSMLASDDEATIVLIAGGWGSSLFREVEGLEESGALVDLVRVQGEDAFGEPITRMAGFVLDRRALLGI